MELERVAIAFKTQQASASKHTRVNMESRVIRMSMPPKKILTSRTDNQAEKENHDHPSIIVNNRLRDSSDTDSDGWAGEAKKKPRLVTRKDGLPQKRQRRPVPSNSPVPTNLPPHVIARRNERERNRVALVNESFAVLRSHIPSHLLDTAEWVEGNKQRKKLSKVETLRLAVHYIQNLERFLEIKSETPDIKSYGSESIKTDSELDSDIVDLSSYPRRDSSSDAESFDQIKIEMDEFDEDFESNSGVALPSPTDSIPYSPPGKLPPITTFSTDSRPVNYVTSTVLYTV